MTKYLSLLLIPDWALDAVELEYIFSCGLVCVPRQSRSLIKLVESNDFFHSPDAKTEHS